MLTQHLSVMQTEFEINSGYSNLECLQIELERIDLLIRREVRRWALVGQDPTDDYRGLYVSALEAETLLLQGVGRSWGQSTQLPQNEEQMIENALAQNHEKRSQLTQSSKRNGYVLLIDTLANVFELDRVSLDIFLLCLASEMDTRYERLFGFLQDNVNRRRPSVRLILDILGKSGVEQLELKRYLSPNSPLIKHNLIWISDEPNATNSQWINLILQPDKTATAWLLGSYEPSGYLQDKIYLSSSASSAYEELLIQPMLLGLERILNSISYATPGQVILVGRDQNRQNAVARWLSAQFAKSLLTLNLTQKTDDTIPAEQLIRQTLRDAQLTCSIPYITGWDRCIGQGELSDLDAYAALIEHSTPVIIGSIDSWQPKGLSKHCPLFWVSCVEPSFRESQALWMHTLRESNFEEVDNPQSIHGFNGHEPHNGHDSTLGIAEEDIENLAGQFTLTSDQIRDAVYAARFAALQSGVNPSAEYLFRSARDYSNPRLSNLARKVEPRYEWGDIILPPNQLMILKELVATIRQRPKVLQEWGLGKKLTASDGVTVLFSGPPGTGKTMAAEVIAKELWLDLYKIDLASVVSKYIGETEKNLERIFSEAANSNAILFFDEADAIFGKRSEVKDAHDRYANIEVSYLLQRMEAYDGVTILATNLRANLDEAFARRLQFAVDFPFPDIADRTHIWQTLFPNDAPAEEGLDFVILAERFELAGGNIRNILVAAAYLAANENESIGMTHLMHAAKRELQKMGRLVGEEDFVF